MIRPYQPLFVACIFLEFFGILAASSSSSNAIESPQERMIESLQAQRQSRFNELGFSLLHVAAALGECSAIELLLSEHEDIDATTDSYKEVRTKKAYKAENKKLRGFLFHATPLHIALLYGNFEAAQLLLVHGADVKNKCDKLDDTLAFPQSIETAFLAVNILPWGAYKNNSNQDIPISLKGLSRIWDFDTSNFLSDSRELSARNQVNTLFGNLNKTEELIRNPLISCLIKEQGGEKLTDSMYAKILRHIRTQQIPDLLCQEVCCQKVTQKHLSQRALSQSSLQACGIDNTPPDPDCNESGRCSVARNLPPQNNEYTILSTLVAARIAKYHAQTVTDLTYLALIRLFRDQQFNSHYLRYVILFLDEEIAQEIIDKIHLALQLRSNYTKKLSEDLKNDLISFAKELVDNIMAKNSKK